MKLLEALDQTDQLKIIVNKIKKECKKSVTNYLKNKLLIRNTNNSDDFYERKQYDKPRMPVDTVNLVDEYIERHRAKHFPNLPSRQKSVFCYCIGQDQLSNFKSSIYGDNCFIIFPTDNKLKTFQSDKYRDFTISKPCVSIKAYFAQIANALQDMEYEIILNKVKNYDMDKIVRHRLYDFDIRNPKYTVPEMFSFFI